MIGGEYEKGLSDYCGSDAALFGSDAIRVFPVGEVLINTGVWCDGVPLLSGAEGVAGLYVWYFGSAVPAVL